MIHVPMKKTISLAAISVAVLGLLFFMKADKGEVDAYYYQQTWPTRTPTSPSSPPTDTPPDGQPTSEPPGGGSGDGTETPESGSGETTPAALAPTPLGGYLPTAEPCNLQPVVQSLGSVNVREGPGIDYSPVGFLVYLEVRPIVGRAGEEAWWYIELVDGTFGWVSDQAVIVSGYTGLVEIMPAPAIDGNTPTPGSPWEPTPNPTCTPPPSPSPSPTTSEEVIEQPSAVTTEEPTLPSISPSPEVSSTPSSIPTETETTAPRPTAAPQETVTAVSTSSETGGGDSEPASIGTSWLLVGGLGLIAAALVSFAIRRR